MRLQQSHCTVSKVLPHTDSVRSFLKQNRSYESDVKEFSNSTIGGILSDLNYTWLCNGSRLQILSTKNGAKVAAWTFGEVIKDYYTRITCVVDLPIINSRNPVLVVGLQSGGTRGMICVFDIRTSRVLRAIQIDKPVTSVHVIDGGCESSLPGALRALDGILAVGTEEGRIYLIDMCRQACEDAVSSCNKEHIRDELTACNLIQITLEDIPMLEKHKETTLQTGDHLCFQLNESCTDNEFILKGSKGETRLRANIVEVKISALHYCPQLGALLVGYNFGAFQLYNLLTIKLEYSSPAYEDCIPVSHFAFQEPCDDPRAFCYIWVMYSNIEKDLPGFPLSVMYSLSYATKEYLEGYGYLYQDLSACSIRFQTELKSLPMSTIQKPLGASCIALTAYTKGVQKYNGGIICQETLEDRLALCSVVWSVFNRQDVEIFMCLFDLNQWYKEQMPSSPNAEDSGSYMIFASLTDLILDSTQSKIPLLDVKIDQKSITQFTSAQRLEEHYFPNALSFRLISVREEDIICIESSGIQRHLLSLVKTAGPLCLLRPTEIFQQCLTHGLSPLHSEITYSAGTSLKLQREMILSVALEHQLISWLCQCAQDWSNGSQSIGGCTLDFLLNWAWNRTTTLKSTVNELCSPLFDYSGMRLDSNALITLNDYARQLKHLTTLYEFILSRCSQFLYESRQDEVELQYSALKMISVYIEVLQWLLNVGLLPECPIYMYPRPDEMERISAPYPVDSLVRFYKKRRQELFEIQGINPQDSQSCDLLFIDNLIDIECGGELLHKDWKNDGGSGLYPPPSLQALLRSYLIEDVDIVYKHCIFIYVFLDLAMTLDQSRYTPIITHLIKFPAVFKLSPSVIKITQAFWQLDHGDFSTAMAQLLDPLVSNEVLQPWHHRIAVKALLAQGQHQHALLYHQVRKPPMTNIQDLLIAITVLIVNDLLKEAFHFQRQNRSECTEKEILLHFMEACDKTNKLFQVIQLPLNEVEEIALIRYLQENRRDETDNYLIQYYLQRSRFAEAFENNDKINSKSFEKQGLLGQIEINSRNSLVQRYKSTLPSVTQDLLSHCSLQKPTTEHNTCHVLERPDPMSVFVHKSSDKLKYKSSLIQASLHKAKETWTNINRKSIGIPFISTPTKVEESCHNLTPIIIPTLVQSLSVKDEENDGPTPTKRQRLSPRQPIGTEKNRSRLSSARSILLNLTPIVKRKTIRSKPVSAASILDCPGSPQSILKVRRLVKKTTSPIDRGNSTTPELIDNSSADEMQPFDELTKDTVKNSIIDLSDYNIQTPKKTVTPRKSLRVSKTPTVHFEDSRPSSPSSEGSLENMEIEVQIETPKLSHYTNHKKETIIPIVLENDQTEKHTRKRKLSDSVTSRKSYKDSSINDTADILEAIDSALETPNVESSKTQFPKVSGRKSLTRKVLEQNTIVKALSSPRKILTRSANKNNAVGVEISHTETVKSYVKEIGTNKVEEISNTNKIETKNMYTTQIDPNTSTQIIKHTHNESYIKSSTQLTELLDDSASDSSIDPILAQGSDVDESFLMKYVQDKSSVYNTLSDSMAKNDVFEETQDDMIEDMIPEDEEIIEIQSIDDKDKTEETTEEYVTIEDSENNEDTDIQMDLMEEKSVAETQPFEITDDLTDEDVSFTMHSSLNVQIDNNKTSNGNIMEMKDMEPENYIEPNFEEEVQNVLAEDSEIDDQALNIEYADKLELEDVENEDLIAIQSSSETSLENEAEINLDENVEIDEEKISIISEDSVEDEGKTQISSDSSDEESSSEPCVEEESEDEEKESDQDISLENVDQVIEVQSSSEDEIMLQINEEIEEAEHCSSTSVDVFEMNITESNLTLDPFETLNHPGISRSVQMNIPANQINMAPLTQTDKIENTSNPKTEIVSIVVDANSEICEVIIPESTNDNYYQNSDVPSCSKDQMVTEKPRRSTRASSVTPVTTNETTRKTRGRSVDVEMVNMKSGVKTLLTPNRRGGNTSIQTEKNQMEIISETNKEIDEKQASIIDIKTVEAENLEQEGIIVVPNQEEELSEPTENVKNKNVNMPVKRDRKPSIQKDTTELAEQKIETVASNEDEENREPQADVLEKEKIPEKRGRKLNIQKDVVAVVSNIDEENQEPQGEVGEKDKMPAKFGRKPSLQKDVTSASNQTEENQESQEDVLEKDNMLAKRGRQPSIQKEVEPVASNQDEKNQESQSDISEKDKIPAKRGRKPSIQKDVETVASIKIEENRESQLVDIKKTEIVSVPAKQGRQPSTQKDVETVASKEEEENRVGQETKKTEIVNTPAKRGRKPSVQKNIETLSSNQEEKDVSEKILPNRRGRKPSVQDTDTPNENIETVSDEQKTESSEKAIPARRGRKPSVQDTDTPNEIIETVPDEQKTESSEKVIPARRGRKPSVQDTDIPKRQTRQASHIADENSKEENLPKEKTTESVLLTPSRRGRKPSISAEETEVLTPVRRSRRTSLQAVEPIIEENEIGTPSRRISTRRTSIQSEQEEIKPSTPSRRNRRLSTQSEDVNLTSTPTRRGRPPSVQSENVKVTPSRKTRASSVLSEEKTPTKSGSEFVDHKRGKPPSVQSENVKVTPSRKTRASSVLSEEKSPTKSGSESVSSKLSIHDKIEEYAATHRLTRRQKTMVEKMMKDKGLPDIDIDPLALLDKESFSGEPDLEEQHHGLSPASSICTESSVGTRSSARLKNKCESPEKSLSDSLSLPSTPKHSRTTRATLKHIESPIPEDENEPTSSGSRVKRKSFTAAEQLMSSQAIKRQRRTSQDSIASETSVQSEALIKIHRLDDAEIDRLRHRSLSPSILKQDAKSDSPLPGKTKKKGRPSILVKPELSKISEENTSAGLDTDMKSEEPKTPVRRGRPKKL